MNSRASFPVSTKDATRFRGLARQQPSWRGIVTVVNEVCTRQALDRSFGAALLESAKLGDVFAADRAHNLQAVVRLVDRARREGVVRPA
jgi:hypothetical protein